MKHIIINLSLVFLTMSVLTSSRENAGINNANNLLKNNHACLHKSKGYAIDLTCKQTPVVRGKSEDTPVAPVADNEVPLSPISRFILLQ
ncbi:MAG: hypothetical protein ABI760_19155 [Ferruginibacter sp.]